MTTPTLLDLLFPPRCPLCGEGLAGGDGAGQGGLCPPCWTGLALPGEPSCTLCQRPLPSEDASHHAEALRCAECAQAVPRHRGVAAATVYNATSRKLVVALKHSRRVALAPFMARLMAARLQGLRDVDAGPDWLVVPVPLHRWRLWGRGFNQSALLARGIAGACGARLMVDALLRRRRTPMLVGMGAKERARILRGAIAVHPRRRQDLAGAKVVLVDDVLTSGATTDACMAALYDAGVSQVVLACFARVTGEALP